MTSNNLIIALFVHDMKAPLAVIELGVKTLLKPGMAAGNSMEEQQQLLEAVLTKKTRAVSLLNNILDLDLAANRLDGTEKKLVKNILFTAIITGLKQMVRQNKKPDALTSAAGTLVQLRSLLLEILEYINTLMRLRGRLQDDASGAETTLSRIARNAKTSVLYIDNAIAILDSPESCPKPTGFILSTLIRETMIEIFDLMDPQTSAKLQNSLSLTELAAVVAENGIRLKTDPDHWDREFPLRGDSLKQVFVNLLMNALKYRKTWVEVTIRYDNRQLIFSVADDGAGIPDQFHRIIFKKRFQIKSENDFPIRGHGIGLAGSQALLNQMNGSLHLRSNREGPTCFSARIDGVDSV